MHWLLNRVRSDERNHDIASSLKNLLFWTSLIKQDGGKFLPVYSRSTIFWYGSINNLANLLRINRNLTYLLLQRNLTNHS